MAKISYYIDDKGILEVARNIFDSIRSGRLDLVEHFAKTDMTKISGNGYCPLGYAISCSNTEIISFLISEYFKLENINRGAKNPLSIAIEKKQYKVIDLLLKHESQFKYLNFCDSSGYSALAVAVEAGYRDLIETLISNGADVTKYGKNGKPPLVIAVKNNNMELIKLLVEHGAEVNSAILMAVEKGFLEIVSYLKENGAIIASEHQDFFLIKAVEARNVQLLTFLIENRVSVKKNNKTHMSIPEFISYTDPNFTPLTRATDLENFEMVKILVENGASVNTCDWAKRHPLGIAISNQSFRIIKYLIDSGADTKLFEKELQELATWNMDFNIYLQSKQLSKMQLSGSGHEEATDNWTY